MFRWQFIFTTMLVAALTWLMAPHFSRAVLAQAGTEPGFLLNVSFEGELQADGWFTGPVTAWAEASDSQVWISHSLNGGPQVEGASVRLEQPGQYQVTWNACKGAVCHDPYTQYLKITAIQPLRFDGRAWSFQGVVIECKAVLLLGMPAEVARVQADGFAAWVILNLDSETHQLGRVVLGDAQIGDPVQVSIAGGENGVDWSQCQPANSGYCQLGGLLDDGSFSPEWNVKVSPSNAFIHTGHPHQHWSQALFWNTSLGAAAP